MQMERKIHCFHQETTTDGTAIAILVVDQMQITVNIAKNMHICNKNATNVIKKRKYTSIVRWKFVNLEKKSYFCKAKNVNKQKNGYS